MLFLDSAPPNDLAILVTDVFAHIKQIPTPVVGVLSSIATLIANRWWRLYQARKRWRESDSVTRVNIGFNIFSEGKLKIRTIMERSIDEIIYNDHLKEHLLAAAARCTHEEPLITGIPAREHHFILQCFVNETAEHFSAGFASEDSGVPGRSTMYLMFLTSEPAKGERHRKIRAMLIKRELLVDFPFTKKMPQLEAPGHADRVRTLQHAAELYHKSPDHFAPFEIFTPLAGEGVDSASVLSG